MEPFKRHPDEQLRVRVTFLANGQPQSVVGCEDMKCSIYKQDGALTPVVVDDHTHCEIEEDGPGTEGDVMYDAPPGTIPTRGRYWMKFLGTIGGVPKAFPQDGYIPLIIE